MQTTASKYYHLPDAAKKCFRYIRNIVNQLVPLKERFTANFFIRDIQRNSTEFTTTSLKKLISLIVKGTYGLNMVYSEEILPTAYAESFALYYDAYASDEFTDPNDTILSKKDVANYFINTAGSPDAIAYLSEGDETSGDRVLVRPVDNFIGDFYAQPNDEDWIRKQIKETKAYIEFAEEQDNKSAQT